MIFQKDMIMLKKNWEKLVKTGFEVIFSYMKTQNFSNPFKLQESMEQYDLVHQVCMSRNAEIRKLFADNLDNQLRQYCAKFVEEMKDKINLNTFIEKWISYSRILCIWVVKVFHHLDNAKKAKNRGSSLKDEIYNIYKEVVYDKFKDNIYHEFENIANDYRNNKEIDIKVCKEYIDFLKFFKENELIEKFMNSTDNYFNNLVKNNINSTFNDYMNFFCTEINKEKKFLSSVFPEEQNTTLSRIQEIVYYKNFSSLLTKEDSFLYMLNNYDLNMKEKLKYTFDIFVGNGNSFSMISKLFKDFVKDNFKQKIIIAENLSNNPEILKPKDVLFKTNFVQSYLNFQRNLSDMINYCFSNNNIMNLNFKDGLADIQSTLDNANLAFILPYFFDDILTKIISDEERQNQINIGLEIFNSVPDKDVFIEIYNSLLANRILSLYNKNMMKNKINNLYINLESNIINVFAKECGNEFVLKSNNIINDYNLNLNEISKKFFLFINEEKKLLNNDINNKDNKEDIEMKPDEQITKKENQININLKKEDIECLINIDTNIRIFSSENWPKNFNIKKALLPESLSSLSNSISSFYHKLYPGRVLDFSLSNSYILLGVKFPLNNIKFDIKCNTFQALILLKFNEIYYKFNNKIKKEELINILKFESNEDFFKYIKQFIDTKLIYQDNDYYSLNCDFKVNNGDYLTYETLEENEVKKKERQEIDRTYPVDGTIVKTVKDNKIIEHKNLILKVLGALYNFNIKEEFIEKRISSLLEREIIFKSKQDPNSYIYNEQ